MLTEVMSSSLDLEDSARSKNQTATAKLTEPPTEKKQVTEQQRKRRRRRQIYQQYAAKFAGKSAYECDRLVVEQLMSELLAERKGQRLSDNEVVKVGSILLQGPVAQQIRRTKGKDAGTTYAMEVLVKAQKVVEKNQELVKRQKLSKPNQKKQSKKRDQGFEM